MPLILLWIFYHALIINSLSQGNNHLISKRKTEDIDNFLQSIEDSEEDKELFNVETYEDGISNKLKEERALNAHFVPIGESDYEFEEDDFYDEDLKREKSLFPAMGHFPSIIPNPVQQPNSGLTSPPNQMPSNMGPRTDFMGRPQSGVFPSGMPGFPNTFTRPLPSSQMAPSSGTIHAPPTMGSPFQGLSPNVLPPSGMPSPMPLQRPNSFPNGMGSNPNIMSPFQSGSPNMFGNNPNSRFPNNFQGNPTTNFPQNQPPLSGQRAAAPIAMPSTGMQPSFPQTRFPQQRPPQQFTMPLPQQGPINPFHPQAPPPSMFPQQQPPVNPFNSQQPLANSFPQQPSRNSFLQQPAMPFPQQQPAIQGPQQPTMPISQQPTMPSQPNQPQPLAKPTLPFAPSGLSPFSSLFPYFFLPFPFGK